MSDPPSSRPTPDSGEPLVDLSLQERQTKLLVDLFDLVAQNPETWPELKAKLSALGNPGGEPVPSVPELNVIHGTFTRRLEASRPAPAKPLNSERALEVDAKIKPLAPRSSKPTAKSAPLSSRTVVDEISDPISDPAAGHVTTSPARYGRKNGIWSKIGGGPLMFAVIFHGLLLFIGAFWILQIIRDPEKKVDFMPAGGGGGERGAEHKVQMKRQAQITPTTNVKRVFAEGIQSNFSIPEQGDDFGQMSPLSSLSGGGLSGGLGGSGSGKGFGKGNGGAGGPGAGGGTGKMFGIPSPFGQKGGDDGIKGIFIDFKLNREGQPTKADPSMASYVKIIQAFKRGGWETRQYPHYSPPTSLKSKFFFFPAIQDKLAAPAFDSKDSGPGLWVAHYRGRITASVPGKYRFVGWGDNILAVKIGRKIVLDASDIGSSNVSGVFGENRESIGAVSFPGKAGTPMFAGDWVDFGRGEEEIEVIVGDQGGIFCAGIFIQPMPPKGKEKDTLIELGAGGLPKLPLFLTGPVTEDERKLLKEVPEASLIGPFFPAKSSSKPKI